MNDKSNTPAPVTHVEGDTRELVMRLRSGMDNVDGGEFGGIIQRMNEAADVIEALTAPPPPQTNLVGEREAIASLRKAVERFTDFELELVAALDGNRLQRTIRNALSKGQEALRSTEVAE